MDMKGIILGAGIAGLSTAIALQRHAIQVNIFESASELKPVGAGILIPPNAIAILERYQLADHIRQAGIAIESLQLVDIKGHPLSNSPARFPRTISGHPTVAIHRASLQKILLDATEPGTLVTGKTCEHIHNYPDQVELSFSDQSSIKGKFLIAADGVYSKIRSILFPSSTLRHSGQICWRGIATINLPDKMQHQLTEAWGFGCRFGFVQINTSHVYWYATITTKEFDKNNHQNENNAQQFLLDYYKNFLSPVQDIIRQTNAQSIRCDKLLDLNLLSQWHSKSTLLIGDAAHATTPNLGQGGAQAIEDSWVLAEKIATSASPQTAFQDFQKLRMSRAQKIVQLSRQIGRLASLSHPATCKLRNAFMRYTPQYLADKQSQQLYKLPY